MAKFTLVYYYEEDFGGDYWGVALFFKGKKLAAWGDYYHDHGNIAATSFAQGYATALGLSCNIVNKNILHEFNNDFLYGGIK